MHQAPGFLEASSDTLAKSIFVESRIVPAQGFDGDSSGFPASPAGRGG